MRYAMRRDPLIKPLLALFGGTEEKSFVEIADGKVRFRFGPFDETWQLADIRDSHPATWSLLGGLGWRLDPFRKRVGIVASLEGVVELELAEARRVKLFPLIPRVMCKSICVSLEEPEAFLRELAGR